MIGKSESERYDGVASDGVASTRTASTRRRSQDFKVRQWLQIGAVSGGLGAALVGYSLLSPQVGVAAADDGGSSSSSAHSSASASKGVAGPSKTGARKAAPAAKASTASAS